VGLGKGGGFGAGYFWKKKMVALFYLEKLALSVFAAGHVSKIFKLESSLSCPHVDGP
jgi:hypothetical protein